FFGLTGISPLAILSASLRCTTICRAFIRPQRAGSSGVSLAMRSRTSRCASALQIDFMDRAPRPRRVRPRSRHHTRPGPPLEHLPPRTRAAASLGRVAPAPPAPGGRRGGEGGEPPRAPAAPRLRDVRFEGDPGFEPDALKRALDALRIRRVIPGIWTR